MAETLRPRIYLAMMGSLRRTALGLLRSDAVMATALLGIGGVGFALGNLLLARALSATEFGAVALFLAWAQIGMITGTVGLEVVIVRHNLRAHRSLLTLFLLVSTPIAIVVAITASLVSGLETALCCAVAITVVAASMTRVAMAYFQAARRVIMSLIIMQINNYVLLAVVPLMGSFRAPQSRPIAAIVAGCYVVTAILAWAYAPRATPASKIPPRRVMLREGATVIGAELAVTVLFQLERLVVPRALSLEALATFAAVAAVAASPFRMLQLGLGFTLLPRLRHCADKAALWRVLRHEALIAVVVGVPTAVALFLAMPWIQTRLLAGRYDISPALTAAVVGVGLVRLWEALASVSVNALGTARDLVSLNAVAWSAVVFGCGASIYASRWGLIGVVLGAGLAWLFYAAAGSLIGLRIVQRRKWDEHAP